MVCYYKHIVYCKYTTRDILICWEKIFYISGYATINLQYSMPLNCIYNFKWNVWLLYLFNCLYVTDLHRLKTEITGRTLNTGTCGMLMKWELYLVMGCWPYRMVKWWWTSALQSMAQWKRALCQLFGLPTLNQCHLLNSWTLSASY